MKIIVAQKGAREHFLAARALHRHGILTKLVVDWYAPSSPVLRWIVSCGSGRRGGAALAACSDEIPRNLVLSNPLNGLIGKWQQTINPFRGSPYQKALLVDAAFTRSVARLKLPPHDAFFGYSYMSLEMLEVERAKGVFTILDQIDPGPVEFHLVAEEMARHPELAGVGPPFPTMYFERLRREWKLADVIVVNSEWSREAIVREGANPAKIEILPLAYESNAEKQQTETLKVEMPKQHADGASPLKILWLGQVNVRKGIHYLIEAARLIERENVRIDVVGAVGILSAAIASAPRNMTFHGPVGRDRATDWYRQSDVFVLPTLSDGFALTQLEALAHGLPVIVTPNCGRIVEDGKTGFLVPPRDTRALADAILKFVRKPGLSIEMRPNCLQVVKMYSVDAYAQRLVEIIQSHLKGKVTNILSPL